MTAASVKLTNDKEIYTLKINAEYYGLVWDKDNCTIHITEDSAATPLQAANAARKLKKYKDKIQDAHIESKNILTSEKKDAENFIKESESKFEQLMINKKKSLQQKLEQMRIAAIKDIQHISNKIALEAVRKIILDPANIDKIKIINQKNLEKTFVQLKQTKIS